MGRGTAILLGAFGAAIALPGLALGLHLPLWIAGAISAAVFGGTWLVARAPAGPGDGLDDDAILQARTDTARGMVSDADAAVVKLEQAARSIKDDAMRTEVGKLAEIGGRVTREVKDDPNRAMAVRRLLTFYLPNAASLAEGWRTLETRSSPSPERIAQTRETMQALGDAFGKFADQAVAPQLQALDLDLKVLNDALKADLEKTA